MSQLSTQSDKEEFLSLCKKINRDGIDNLIEWLLRSDFFTAPASTRFHGSYEGGLLRHSLNVYHEMCRILKAYPEFEFSEESVIIASLFHDLCKVNFYGFEERNRKNPEGKWEKYLAYCVKEKFPFGGHGSKSVFLVQNFIKLTPEEAIAINCHMSAFGDNAKDVGKAFEYCPFAWLLSVADQSASYVIEGERSSG